MTAGICSAANDKATKKIAGASKFRLFCNQHTSAFPSFYEPRFRIFDHSVRSDDPHVLPKVRHFASTRAGTGRVQPRRRRHPDALAGRTSFASGNVFVESFVSGSTGTLDETS